MDVTETQRCCWDIVWRLKQIWCSVMVAVYIFTFCTSHTGSLWKVMRFAVLSGKQSTGEQNHSPSLERDQLSSISHSPSGAGIVVCVSTNLKRLAKIIEMLSLPLPPPSSPPWFARLSVALCAGEHDPLRVPAASLRPQRWQLANGRGLHQQPARQVEVVLQPLPR